MKLYSLFAVAAGAAAILAISPTAHAAPNLLGNGSFEKPAAPNGGFIIVAQGERIGAWRVVGEPGEVGLINENYSTGGFSFPPRKGKQSLDLTPRATLTPTRIGVQQRVPTTPGQEYELTFFVGNVRNPGGQLGTTSTIDVFVDGQLLMSATNRGGSGQTTLVWKKFSATLTATKARTTVAFINADNDDLNGLDAVSLVVAP